MGVVLFVGRAAVGVPIKLTPEEVEMIEPQGNANGTSNLRLPWRVP